MILDVTVRQAATDVTTATRSLVIEVAGRMGLQGPPGADSTVPGPQGDPGPAGADSTVPGPQGDPGVAAATSPLDLTAGTISVAVGTTSGTVAAGDDSRFTDARTPTAHASTHATAGSDPVSISSSQVSGLSAYALLAGATFTAPSAGVVPLTAKGASGQTADLFQARNSSGTTLASVSATGYIATSGLLTGGIYDAASTGPYLGLTTSTAQVVNRNTVSNVAWQVFGMAGQTGDLQRWNASGPTTVASISAAGAGTFNGLTVAAGYDINAAHAAANNTRYGVGALKAAATGTENVAVGVGSLAALTSGGANIAVGRNSGASLTAGAANVFLGRSSGYSVGSNSGNTFVGYLSGSQSTGGYGIAIGYLANRYGTTQSNELFINSLDRTNRAGDVSGSIIYGVQSATPSSQTVTLNAVVNTPYSLAVGGAGSYGGGIGVLSLTNATTVPTTDPAGGGVLYSEGGALKWRGSSGTVSTIAPA